MNTITIEVEDNKVMAGLRKVLKSMRGVTIVSNRKKAMTGIEESEEDIRCGRVTEYKNADEMFKKLGI